MNRDETIDAFAVADTQATAVDAGQREDDGARLLRRLVEADRVPAVPQPPPLVGAVVGRLVALVDQGRTPLVAYDDMSGDVSLRARSTVELDGRHVGHPVVLNFEHGDPSRPLIVGRLICDEHRVPPDGGEGVQLEVDGERMVVSARGQLVLRCGRASITLDADGSIELRGETIVSQAVGANHLRGGSVQLN